MKSCKYGKYERGRSTKTKNTYGPGERVRVRKRGYIGHFYISPL